MEKLLPPSLSLFSPSLTFHRLLSPSTAFSLLPHQVKATVHVGAGQDVGGGEHYAGKLVGNPTQIRLDELLLEDEALCCPVRYSGSSRRLRLLAPPYLAPPLLAPSLLTLCLLTHPLLTPPLAPPLISPHFAPSAR